MSDLVAHATDSDFEADVVNTDSPVLLDFPAEWCGPRKTITPRLGAVTEECNDRPKVIKLNVDDNPRAALKDSVSSIPTLLLFKDGVVAAQQASAESKAQLTAFPDQHFGSASA